MAMNLRNLERLRDEFGERVRFDSRLSDYEKDLYVRIRIREHEIIRERREWHESQCDPDDETEDACES